MTDDVLELPDLLDNCPCPARDRDRFGDKFRSRRTHHYSNCNWAREFEAGNSAGSSAKFAKPPVTTPPEGSSEVFTAGWEHGQHDGPRRAISWNYPVRVSGAPADINMDPVVWFRERLDRYADYEPEDAHAYEGWEKPLNFLHDTINEELRFAMSSFDANTFGSDVELKVSFSWEPWPRQAGSGHYRDRWNEHDTAQLHQALGLEDAHGNALELIRDPKNKRVRPPQPAPAGALPLPETFMPAIRDNYEFASRYLDEARSAVTLALDSGISIDDLTAGWSSEMRVALLAEAGVR